MKKFVDDMKNPLKKVVDGYVIYKFKNKSTNDRIHINSKLEEGKDYNITGNSLVMISKKNV